MSLKPLISRKFILAILSFIAIFVLTLTGTISAEQFLDAIKWIIGLYIVGNTASKVVTPQNQ